MTFKTILKAVIEENHCDCCFIADHMKLEDEVVEKWETGDGFPNEKEAKLFADLFVLPLKLVLSSIEEGKKEKLK